MHEYLQLLDAHPIDNLAEGFSDHFFFPMMNLLEP